MNKTRTPVTIRWIIRQIIKNEMANMKDSCSGVTSDAYRGSSRIVEMFVSTTFSTLVGATSRRNAKRTIEPGYPTMRSSWLPSKRVLIKIHFAVLNHDRLDNAARVLLVDRTSNRGQWTNRTRRPFITTSWRRSGVKRAIKVSPKIYRIVFLSLSLTLARVLFGETRLIAHEVLTFRPGDVTENKGEEFHPFSHRDE